MRRSRTSERGSGCIRSTKCCARCATRGLSIDVFTEHYQVPWRIFPITVPQGDGMFGWPAERWLPLSYEVVATAH